MTHDDSPRGKSNVTHLAGVSNGSTGSLTEVTTDQLIELLARENLDEAALLAFDADGTLWTGDVSDDVFLCACREAWLLDAALPALRRLASSNGLETWGSPSEVALRLFEANQNGHFDECTLFAMMAWCYAGRTLRELTDYATAVLMREALSDRLRPELKQVLSWARHRHLRCVVVSASPQPIVAWAASLWGFSPEDVIGTTPLVRDNVIADQLVDRVPFGANKCTVLKRHCFDRPILASFGDSHFDFEMLECAVIPVAVSPKSTLRSRLLRLSRAVVLSTQTLAPRAPHH